jgi:hypothetical protein
MAKQALEDDEPTLGSTLQSLLTAGVRMSAGFTLYGLEQFERTVEAVRSDGLSAAAAKLRTALDTVSDSLENGVDETKKEALRSVSRVTAKALEKYAEILSPSAIAETTNKLMGKRTRPASSPSVVIVAAPADSPRLAADVLMGPDA